MVGEGAKLSPAALLQLSMSWGLLQLACAYMGVQLAAGLLRPACRQSGAERAATQAERPAGAARARSSFHSCPAPVRPPPPSAGRSSESSMTDTRMQISHAGLLLFRGHLADNPNFGGPSQSPPEQLATYASSSAWERCIRLIIATLNALNTSLQGLCWRRREPHANI